jgi:hypothetical protein
MWMGECATYVGALAWTAPIGPTETNIETTNEKETRIKSTLPVANFMSAAAYSSMRVATFVMVSIY